jgi:hypothetical protein
MKFELVRGNPIHILMSISRLLAILVTATCLLAGAFPAYARTCRIIYPDRPQSSPKLAHLFDGSKSREVTLPSMNFSEVIRLPNGEISIALTTDEIVNPELLPSNAPKLRIPEKVNDFYIILTPDPDNSYLPVTMNLADAGEGKIRSGETLWFNYTAHRIVAKLGDAEMSVDPKGRSISKAPAKESGYYAAQFAYQVQGEGPLARITEQNWWHDSKSRSVAFIIETGGRLPRIFAFRDFREAIEPAKEGESEQPVVAE